MCFVLAFGFAAALVTLLEVAAVAAVLAWAVVEVP
jgi:hypothetical protein